MACIQASKLLIMSLCNINCHLQWNCSKELKYWFEASEEQLFPAERSVETTPTLMIALIGWNGVRISQQSSRVKFFPLLLFSTTLVSVYLEQLAAATYIVAH